MAFFRETSRKNHRNRPVGQPPKVAIRACCGTGWVGEGVQPSMSAGFSDRSLLTEGLLVGAWGPHDHARDTIRTAWMSP